MEKSRNNELVEDGITTLKYKKLNEREEDLYTWFLVKLPPPPEKKAKPAWTAFQVSCIQGPDHVQVC